MDKGKVEFAERKAIELFDKWNDSTGVISKFTGYYYEAIAVIKDSVNIGIMSALDIEFTVNNGVLKQKRARKRQRKG